MTIAPFDNDTSELLLGTLNNDGTLSSFDQLPAELLRPFDASELVGTWESQYVDSGNFSLCLLGFCCATIIDQFFHFRADGQYLFQESSESFSSADLGNVSTFANGAGSDASTGSYSVNGNLISLMTAQGETFELPIHITRDGNLVVGVFQYFASE